MATSPNQFWQLTVNGGTPQTFAQSFFRNVRRALGHTDIDVLSFTASGRAIDAAPLMSFGDAVAVTRNGKPFFAGTVLPPRLVGRPNEENHAYTVVSPCYDLARTFYQQANLPAVSVPINPEPGTWNRSPTSKTSPSPSAPTWSRSPWSSSTSSPLPRTDSPVMKRLWSGSCTGP
jgi:hypothetical protein